MKKESKTEQFVIKATSSIKGTEKIHILMKHSSFLDVAASAFKGDQEQSIHFTIEIEVIYYAYRYPFKRIKKKLVDVF